MTGTPDGLRRHPWTVRPEHVPVPGLDRSPAGRSPNHRSPAYPDRIGPRLDPGNRTCRILGDPMSVSPNVGALDAVFPNS